jgi:hypothetical protein
LGLASGGALERRTWLLYVERETGSEGWLNPVSTVG